MSKKVGTNLDLLLNELQQAKIQCLATDPTGAVQGQVYYNTADLTLRVYNGTAWVKLGYLNQQAATGDVSFGGYKLTNVATPINGTDAANKDYVDGIAQGIDAKGSCRVATTANITLSGTQTIDGVAVVAGDRVLVKDQTAPAQNGIYVAAAGAWARATDADTWTELVGAFTFVEEGTSWADTGWVSSVNAGGTLGTTAVNWVQFSHAGTVTASNVGTAGVGVFKQKTGANLEFKTLNVPSGQGGVTLTDDTANNEIDITLSAKLEALHDNATTGLIAQTAASTVAARTITGPAAGITVTNGNGVSGNPTLALANDLAGVEGLSTTGLATRTADGTWTTRAVTAGNDISVSNGDGVAGAPTVAVDATTLHDTRKFGKYFSTTWAIAATPTNGTKAINHALNNQYAMVQVFDSSGNDVVVDVTARADANNLTLSATGLPVGTYQVIVEG